MTVSVAVSAFAVWTPAGVWVDAAPDAGTAGTPGVALAPWPGAPKLAEVHPRARRPHAQATALVQLAHALLSAREARAGERFAAPPRSEVDLLLGTQTGSSAADLDFHEGLHKRGLAFGSPSTFVYTLGTAAPAEVALALGLRGALATVTAGSVSGLTAVVRAAARIAAGRSRACVCGGVELGTLGERRASSVCGQDLLALFLLEPAVPAAPWPTLEGWEAGFSAGGEPPRAGGAPEAHLLTLASAVARARAEVAPRGAAAAVPGRLAGVSPEGHTAGLTLVPPAG